MWRWVAFAACAVLALLLVICFPWMTADARTAQLARVVRSAARIEIERPADSGSVERRVVTDSESLEGIARLLESASDTQYFLGRIALEGATILPFKEQSDVAPYAHIVIGHNGVSFFVFEEDDAGCYLIDADATELFDKLSADQPIGVNGND